MTTGPLHWELLARSRANDLQLYMGIISPARDIDAGYVAWGHSTLVNPWGVVTAKAGHEEEILLADIGQSKKKIVFIFLKQIVGVCILSVYPVNHFCFRSDCC